MRGRCSVTILALSVLPKQNGRAARGVASVNVNTGEMRDLAFVPGDHHGAPVFIKRPNHDAPRVELSMFKQRHRKAYRVDLERGSLMPDPSLGPEFRFEYDGEDLYLLERERRLDDSHGANYAATCPDGRRIAWLGDWVGRTGHSLRVRDADKGETCLVIENRVLSSVMWIADEDLEPAPAEIPEGWSPLPSKPWRPPK